MNKIDCRAFSSVDILIDNKKEAFRLSYSPLAAANTMNNGVNNSINKIIVFHLCYQKIMFLLHCAKSP